MPEPTAHESQRSVTQEPLVAAGISRALRARLRSPLTARKGRALRPLVWLGDDLTALRREALALLRDPST